MAPSATSDTINPYSIAVAPRRDARSEANFSRIRFMVAIPVPWFHERSASLVNKILHPENALPMNLLLVSAAALVDDQGRILVQQRSHGRSMAGLWEFPGGKVEPGETPEHALVRELHEELGIDVDPDMLSPAVFGSEPLGDSHLLLLLYLCREWRGTPAALDADGLQWILPGDLRTLAMPPADIPMIAVLERLV